MLKCPAMWKFANPIKHPIPDTRWPTRAEAANSLLFQPIKIGSLQFSSRTWVPAMVPWRATEDGFVTQDNLDWYRRFAEGRPGALVVEATGIRDIPSGPLLRISHDRFLPGLRQLVETVREASDGHTKLFIQIIDFLAVKRRPDPSKYFQRFLEITEPHRQIIAEITEDSSWITTDETNVRDFLNASSNRCASVIVNASLTGTCRTFATCPRSCLRSLRKRPSEAETLGSTASSCITRTPIRWPAF